MTNLTKKTAWHKALDYDELLEDSVKHVVFRHTHICMTHYKGTFAALSNKCPHQVGR